MTADICNGDNKENCRSALLVELWDASGPVRASPAGNVGEAGIVRLLNSGSTFVVADVGRPLEWIDCGERFAFWKNEVKHRLVPPDAPIHCLADYPDQYCYVAVKWDRDASEPVIVLEKPP